MTDRDDRKQPLDHLPPEEEHADVSELDKPQYPDTGEPSRESAVSPETAKEPEAPNRHGVDNLPPTGR